MKTTPQHRSPKSRLSRFLAAAAIISLTAACSDADDGDDDDGLDPSGAREVMESDEPCDALLFDEAEALTNVVGSELDVTDSTGGGSIECLADNQVSYSLGVSITIFDEVENAEADYSMQTSIHESTLDDIHDDIEVADLSGPWNAGITATGTDEDNNALVAYTITRFEENIVITNLRYGAYASICSGTEEVDCLMEHDAAVDWAAEDYLPAIYDQVFGGAWKDTDE